MNKITPTCLLLTLALAGCQSDDTTAHQSPTKNADTITQQKQGLAKQLSVNYTDIEQTLKSQISEQKLSISLSTLLAEEPQSSFTQQMQKADTNIRTIKGVSNYTDELLELRLADTSMVQEWKEGESPLFAFEPTGDDESWQYIEAYDVYGQLHQLDVYQMPEVPVFVVDNNSAKELKAGLQAMQAEMTKLGQPAALHNYDENAQQAQFKTNIRSASAAPISTTAIKKIRLSDDEEPWISGKAEVYAIVTGVNPSRDEPTLDLVEMPYLDYDNKDYYPNQIVIHWSRYRWGAADMILMEQDDGTDYKELAKLLVQVAEEVLKMIPDPEVQAYAIIPQITGKIIAAIPDGVLVNDDDFVDVYYTLLQDTSYVDHPAAGGNAVATLEPLTISPTRP
ncbi:DUF3103 domain-containing protein [Photobacterium sp. SDRW27]|uniref:DUF3103 domain-containing protein n=1 Tax=Photobacterium obscurum TaxID=2829490 RepID=UPI002243601E|nr:DUF3103 domain-containing protein [Photobacterium obscurum]MCW8327658.1 DUF3103 domain-containing protein [Photobacterium obscurum]